MNKQLRAVLGNAAFWGASWGAACIAVLGALTLFGPMKIGGFAAGSLFLAPRFALFGALSGAVCSAAITVLFRGRRLRDLSVAKFVIGGAVGTGLFVPTFMQLMNVLSGDGMVAFSLIAGDAITTAVMGGFASGASLKLAQLAERVSPTTLDDVITTDSLPTAAFAPDVRFSQHDTQTHVPR
jgi:hypothetical protein